MIIPVAHDFICPWCWIGLFQAKDLATEFGVTFEWRAYELYPQELEWPAPAPVPETDGRPKTPSRLQLAIAAQNLVIPKVEKPHQMRTHQVHNAVEYAKTEGPVDEFIEVLYRAYWEQGTDINDPEQILKLSTGLVRDQDALMDAIKNSTFKSKIVGFDDDAYASGIYNVPTFIINGSLYAEQPTTVLRAAILKGASAG